MKNYLIEYRFPDTYLLWGVYIVFSLIAFFVAKRNVECEKRDENSNHRSKSRINSRRKPSISKKAIKKNNKEMLIVKIGDKNTIVVSPEEIQSLITSVKEEYRKKLNKVKKEQYSRGWNDYADVRVEEIKKVKEEERGRNVKWLIETLTMARNDFIISMDQFITLSHYISNHFNFSFNREPPPVQSAIAAIEEKKNVHPPKNQQDFKRFKKEMDAIDEKYGFIQSLTEEDVINSK